MDAAIAANPNVTLGTAVVQAGVNYVEFAGGDLGDTLRIVDPPLVLINARRHRKRGKLRDGQCTLVGYEKRNNNAPFVLATAPVVTGPEFIPPTPTVLAALLQWGRVGRIESGSRDTGDRNGTDETFPGDVLGVWQLPTFLHKFADGVVACARVASNRVWYLALETEWVLRALHFDANLSTETDPAGGRQWTLAGMTESLPLTMALHGLPLDVDGALDQVDVYTTWCGRPPE